MNIDRFEIKIHDMLIKMPWLRHSMLSAYQHILYAISPKIKAEGNFLKVSPNDGREYFFGYYDKTPWNSTEQFVLCLAVKNSTISTAPSESADIILINLNNKVVRKIAQTVSWNVQQGCMLQWYDDNHIFYNDYIDKKYCGVVYSLIDDSKRTIQMPLYTISQDRSYGLSLDFSRLHRLRKGYGYSNIPDATEGDYCPDRTCIWKFDLLKDSHTPLLSYKDLVSFKPRPEMEGAEHKVNHLMIRPDGKRFMFLHRWVKGSIRYSRLLTCNSDGTNLFNLSDNDFVSHCCWKNNDQILSYLNKKDKGKGYYLLNDFTQEYVSIYPELKMDGHPTFSPNGKSVITDTYPDRKRIQSLYKMEGTKVTRVARFFSPFKYKGDVRCDLHPRWNYSGDKVCIDATFEGKRAVYVAYI